MRSAATAAALVSGFALVSAHGHVNGIVADGVYFKGADPALAYSNPYPSIAGWKASNLDNGFVSPDAFANPDIICHKAAIPGTNYVTVKAGGTVALQWNTWPVSHAGPVIDYLAPCAGECPTADKTALRFSKIAAAAYRSGSNPGKWATDELIANNNTWTFTVPAALKAGNYVLRHEILALHAAGSPNGAQAYPQCVNLKVTGGGAAVLSGGVAGTALYKANDPGVVFNLYSSFSSYTIPGPALWSAGRKMLQRFSAEDNVVARA